MHPDSELIDKIGGTGVVAELCEVRPPSVSEWRKREIPKARLLYLKVIRPDLNWRKRDRDAAAFMSVETQ